MIRMINLIDYIKKDYTMIIIVLITLIIAVLALGTIKDYENKCELQCQENIKRKCPNITDYNINSIINNNIKGVDNKNEFIQSYGKDTKEPSKEMY